ncbi:MAG: response regulator [Pseudomonadales bacterium]|nr:response regulator [Pseudomonadales bacterium]
MRVVVVESDSVNQKEFTVLCGTLEFEVEAYRTPEELEQALMDGPSEDRDLFCIYQHDESPAIYDLCRSIRAAPTYHHSPMLMLYPELQPDLVGRAMAAGVTETFAVDQKVQLTAFLRRFGEFRQKISGHVLLVEDSISQQRLARAILEDVGLTVETAVDVPAAWSLYKKHIFDLVITDLVLAGDDTGMALIQRIRRLETEKGDTPIIVMSSYDDDARRVELFRLGVNEFISKPIFFEELVARTRYLVLNSQLKHEVHEQKQELEKKNRFLNEYIGRISHEFRNSINVELGVAKMLEKKAGFDERQKELVGMVKNAAEHQLCLVNDILDYMQMESGSLRLDEIPCLIHEVPKTIAGMFSYKCEDSPLQISYSVANDVPEEICVDQTKLNQILMNFMGNAVKFTVDGEVQLDLSLEQKDGQDWICCQVRDTGPGIADAEREDIFLAFNQTELGKNETQSTGLGLAICVSLAELMSGHLAVESEVGKGSCFSYTFPMQLVH